ncbi:MAG: AAA family ATPase [Deltaproteobacteria bacterium]|nr:AAA family ATPase [Deltaproteobacteria bacterium]
MIRLIPPTRLEDVEHSSERDLLRALLRLPSPWVAMHSLPWLRPDRGRVGAPLREGEADFVLLHPDRGLLVVEVKGGALRVEGREWHRGADRIVDPIRQAARSRWALLDAVADRAGWPEVRHELAHGDVVVTPHHRWRGALPPHADPRMLVDADGLEELEARLTAALDAWGPARPVPAGRWQPLLDALAPSLRLVRCDAAAIDAEAARLVQLTEAQHAALLGLLAASSALVEGGAGSGKTLLAVTFAERLRAEGARCLLVCFNRSLAEWLQERIGAGGPGRVDVHSFHGLAMGLARRAGVEVEVPEGPAAEAFWRDEAARVLEQAVEVLQGEPGEPIYDALVVDEAQDMEVAWLDALDTLCPSGRRYLFADLAQRLRTGAPPLARAPLALRLETNCRNTRRIAAPAAALSSLPLRPLALAPEGEPPVHARAARPDQLAAVITAEVTRTLGGGLRPSQVVVLGPARLARGPLAGAPGVCGAPLTDDPRRWRAGDGLLVSTPRAFKGLEAEAAVLYCPPTWSASFTPADLYVGWTRARHRLTVITTPGEVRGVVEALVMGAPVPLPEQRA